METSLPQSIDDACSLPYFERRVAIAKIAKPRLPRFVYKFRALDPSNENSIDRVRDILVHSHLWQSSPADFNDPFDMLARIVEEATGIELRNHVKGILKEHGVKHNKMERAIAQFCKKSKADRVQVFSDVFSTTAEKAGVVSFGGDPRSILMWSHYAHYHSGICIQFECARDFQTFSGAIPVTYKANYPVIDWVTNFEESLGEVMRQKHEGWTYERESRIIRPGEARKKLKFDSDAVTRIIVGCRASEKTKQVVHKLVAERTASGLSKLTVYEAQQHESRYRLVIRRKSDS